MLVQKGCSLTTIINYRCDITHWLTHIAQKQNNESVINLELSKIEKYFKYCIKHKSKNSMKRRKSSLSCFYDFLIKRHLYKGNNPIKYINVNVNFQEGDK